MEIKKNRIALLDEVRGFCVLCMIFYHSFIFMYDQFGISFGYRAYMFFQPVQPLFSCAFMFICGICCKFSHNNIKRAIKLLVLALALSFISIVVLPSLGFTGTQIYFGILHFLSISILLYALLEKPLSKVPALLGCIICILLLYIFRDWEASGTISLWDNLSYSYPDSLHEMKWLFPFGIQNTDFYSADYFPLIPYLFVFIFGSYVGVYARAGKVPNFAYPIHIKPLYWLGTHALLVYIIHLPIVYLLLSFYEWIIGLIAA